MKTKEQILNGLLMEKMPLREWDWFLDTQPNLSNIILEAMETYRNHPSPYQPGQKSVHDYLRESLDDFKGGITGAALLALNKQRADSERELIEFARFATMGISEKSAIEYVEQFRASRSGKQTEG